MVKNLRILLTKNIHAKLENLQTVNWQIIPKLKFIQHYMHAWMHQLRYPVYHTQHLLVAWKEITEKSTPQNFTFLLVLVPCTETWKESAIKDCSFWKNTATLVHPFSTKNCYNRFLSDHPYSYLKKLVIVIFGKRSVTEIKFGF